MSNFYKLKDLLSKKSDDYIFGQYDAYIDIRESFEEIQDDSHYGDWVYSNHMCEILFEILCDRGLIK